MTIASILEKKKSEVTTTNQKKIRVKWDKINRKLIKPEFKQLASEELVETLKIISFQNDLENDCNIKKIDDTSNIVNFSSSFNNQQTFFSDENAY